MFFDGGFGLFRILTVGMLGYIALIVLLRLSGKRTLSKWNAFDFVVTIALGSTLATLLLSKDVTLLEGVFGLALLIALQVFITWISIRSSLARRFINSEPTLLLDRGEFLHDALKLQRVKESEIRAAVRSAGLAALEQVEAVVLETDGTFSVIKHNADSSRSALADIPVPVQRAERRNAAGQ